MYKNRAVCREFGRFAKESRRDSRLGSFGTPTEPPGSLRKAKRRFSIDSPFGLSTENVVIMYILYIFFMEKTMKNNETMIEPIEEVVGAVADLEEKSKNMEIIEVKSENMNEATPVVAVVSTMNESPDFKSIVKTPLETKKTSKKRRKCKKGSRRYKGTHRCRKKKPKK